MSEQNHSKQGGASPYDVFMLALCLITLILMTVSTMGRLDEDVKTILQWADTGICAIFFFDFLLNLWRAENRWRYFITWGWLDLLSSIPSVDAFRWGRIGRIFRVFRLLRGVRAARLLTGFIFRKRAQNTFLAAALLSILTITFASIAVLQFENGDDSNIKTPGDAVWWSLVTLTTVGYGDRFPVTTEGRFVGALLMIAGIGLFGIMSGFVASWFLSPTQKEEESEIEALRRDIAELRALVLESQGKTAPAPQAQSKDESD